MQTVVIAGGTGLLGKHLSHLLTEKGYAVRHLSRKRNLEATFPAFAWNLNAGTIDEDVFQNADYVINLAGANLADSRWTKARKKVIIESRTQSTLLLKSAIEKMDERPKAYISASAIGFYGNSGEQLMKETAAPGNDGFISECVVAWEKAIEKVNETGIRTVALRTGVVLSTKGGALKELLTPFKFLTGSYFGNGQQWYSWIHIEDMSRIFLKAIEDDNIKDIYNAVAPNPERCKDLVYTLKKALKSPALVLPVPAFTLKLIMGEMSSIILDSTKVSSEKIQKAGYEFKFPELLPALKDILERKI